MTPEQYKELERLTKKAEEEGDLTTEEFSKWLELWLLR